MSRCALLALLLVFVAALASPAFAQNEWGPDEDIELDPDIAGVVTADCAEIAKDPEYENAVNIFFLDTLEVAQIDCTTVIIGKSKTDTIKSAGALPWTQRFWKALTALVSVPEAAAADTIFYERRIIFRGRWRNRPPAPPVVHDMYSRYRDAHWSGRSLYHNGRESAYYPGHDSARSSAASGPGGMLIRPSPYGGPIFR